MNLLHKSKAFLPVIHCCNQDQVFRNLEIAQQAGVDGVFLIDQGGMSWQEIIDIFPKIKTKYDFFVGANFLWLDYLSAVHMAAKHNFDAIWLDYCGVDYQDVENSKEDLRLISETKKKYSWNGLVFGGVAFKYFTEVPPEYYGVVAKLAAENGIDVVTTSGPRTGVSPDVEKIKTMKEAVGDHSLAIASGITSENVELFLPYTDRFLVASGIERTFGEFDLDETIKLSNKIHNH